ncbi:Uncharacterised protein [BD1-7 clade bacterium]|uniref:Uncharacterized protein n=1 Tax=BD1-7 clade bacterium TaxID=2029982 RepID=A0A5S9NUN1_9GAMM|nr:Uncharacterised protein [BD1-7 clade bacterium]CAA0094398.1 Uncharacterised protein [BD1-7 clade bacterium]
MEFINWIAVGWITLNLFLGLGLLFKGKFSGTQFIGYAGLVWFSAALLVLLPNLKTLTIAGNTIELFAQAKKEAEQSIAELEGITEQIVSMQLDIFTSINSDHLGTP